MDIVYIRIINGKEVDNQLLLIPSHVTSISRNCFINCDKLKELILPESLKAITYDFFDELIELEYLTTSSKYELQGNKLFYLQKGCLFSINLPPKIREVNGKQVDDSVIIIPSFITSIDKYCLNDCKYLKQLYLPKSLTYIQHDLLSKLPFLEELTISEKYQFYGNRLFGIIDNDCLHSISLPTSIKKINDRYPLLYRLTSFTIPTTITKVNDYCFANCTDLIELNNLEQIQQFGIGCFMNCPKLDKEQYPQVKENIKDYIRDVLYQKEISQLEEWTELKCSDIIFDSDVDDWSKNTFTLMDRIIGKKQLVFLIEDEEDEELFGYYLNTGIPQEYNKWIETNYESFEFNLHSNGRLQEPMKFEIIDLYHGGCHLSLNSSWNNLILLGDISLRIENVKNNSECWTCEDRFDYHGIEYPLCGKWKFTPKRILVIQMK